MSLAPNADELFQGFSKLTREERFERLIELGALCAEDIAFLKHGGIKQLDLADKLIENVIGYFQLPLGVATNFTIDGQDYVIPLAVEETSIIAALSKSAKWIRQHGEITTSIKDEGIIGQIQLAKIKDFDRFSRIINENKQYFIQIANEDVAANMVKRGGGVTNLEIRRLAREDGQDMAVIHLSMNSCDAMGANIINQVLEYLKNPIEELTGEEVTMCILSNLNDQKLTSATVTIKNIDPELGYKLQEASLFAEMDPYRAATHNKGVMNGIDPVLIATGNDWRAVEAGVHAFAARSGHYQAITRWRYENEVLTGTLTAPIIVGTVGGVTALHPTAKICLKMMNIQSANQLSRVIAAVGLVQNLGAIKALCTDGIIQGHMKLHIDNLLMVAGANEKEVPMLKEHLQKWLDINKRVSLTNANDLLAKIRETQIAL
ncbi:MAG: hydroxymethylglutaryl-CoA reductase, degradative [Legionella sp.]|jgi:hydroxymethylglutaryl-CoA reductase